MNEYSGRGSFQSIAHATYLYGTMDAFSMDNLLALLIDIKVGIVKTMRLKRRVRCNGSVFDSLHRRCVQSRASEEASDRCEHRKALKQSGLLRHSERL